MMNFRELKELGINSLVIDIASLSRLQDKIKSEVLDDIGKKLKPVRDAFIQFKMENKSSWNWEMPMDLNKALLNLFDFTEKDFK